MFKVELCPKSSNYVTYKQLPRHLVSALIASEDSSFFFHKGFDWDEIQDSLEKSLDAGRWVRGGSTLTQQLAKNLYLNQDRSLIRKIKEFYIANKIEKTLNKPQIIEKYLNVVEFGDKVYGIKKAAQYYFAKSPAQLTAGESAYLISLLPSPIKYSSAFRGKKELSKYNKKRSQRILALLRRQGQLSDNEFDEESSRIENGLWLPLDQIPKSDSPQFSNIYFEDTPPESEESIEQEESNN